MRIDQCWRSIVYLKCRWPKDDDSSFELLLKYLVCALAFIKVFLFQDFLFLTLFKLFLYYFSKSIWVIEKLDLPIHIFLLLPMKH